MSERHTTSASRMAAFIIATCPFVHSLEKNDFSLCNQSVNYTKENDVAVKKKSQCNLRPCEEKYSIWNTEGITSLVLVKPHLGSRLHVSHSVDKLGTFRRNGADW